MQDELEKRLRQKGNRKTPAEQMIGSGNDEEQMNEQTNEETNQQEELKDITKLSRIRQSYDIRPEYHKKIKHLALMQDVKIYEVLDDALTTYFRMIEEDKK